MPVGQVMMYRGLSLRQVLSVSAILAATAIVLVPTVAAQGGGKGDGKSWQIAQLQSLGTGMLAYSSDWDDCFPLATFKYPNNVWGGLTMPPTPADCIDNPPWNTPERIRLSAATWRNAVTSYTTASNYLPGAPVVMVPEPQVGSPMLNHSSMNGLLHSLPTASVSSPSILPLLWSGFQRVNIQGRAGSNPALLCGNSPVCRFNPNAPPSPSTSGSNYAMGFWDQVQPVWIYGQRYPAFRVDGSVTLLPIGTAVGPNMHPWPTANEDPWARVEPDGHPTYIYLCGPGHTVATPNQGTTANQYPCYFRPDRTE